MSTGDEESLRRLVESVIDGRAVDWEAQVFADPATRERVNRLRILASIADVHQGPGGPEDGGSPGGPAPLGTWGAMILEEKLAGGRTGEVFRAFDPSLQRHVALKLQLPDAPHDPAAASAYLDEARRLARVRHPHVLFVHGVGRHDGRVGLWTDLVKGRTLEECLQAQGPFGPREALLIGIDLCRALAAVHAEGLIHRDLKTSNVMREEGGRIILMDFGITVDAGNPSGAVSGSPIYMAPELFQGQPPSRSSDIYALGVVLFRLVTGRYPYASDSLEDLVRGQKEGSRIRLVDARPDVPPGFAGVVEKCLELEPGDRFATAGEMEGALGQVQGDRTETGGGTGGPSDGRRRPRAGDIGESLVRSGGAWRLAALATGLAMLIAGGLALRRPAAPAFSVEATLYRKQPEVDERIEAGGRVQPGDRLFLEVEGSRDLNLYVLNEDEKGHAFVLFPLPDLDLRNPLPAKTRHRVPGSRRGAGQTWEVDTRGGRETLLLIASAEPLEEIEAEIRAMPRPESGPGKEPEPESGARTVRRVRGIGRLADEGSPGTVAENRLSRILDKLDTAGRKAPEVWVRRIEVENPARP